MAAYYGPMKGRIQWRLIIAERPKACHDGRQYEHSRIVA